jgi:hypothetical protein
MLNLRLTALQARLGTLYNGALNLAPGASTIANASTLTPLSNSDDVTALESGKPCL